MRLINNINSDFVADNNKPTCVGTGLVALDVIIDSIGQSKTDFLAGGSCGNVLSILAYFGWSSFPIARLSNNTATELLLNDLYRWNVREDLLEVTPSGSTPIIIHRILKDSQGLPKHRFEFRNPEDGKYLPSFRPILAKSVPQILSISEIPNVFYFDRISRSSIEFAKYFKEKGSIIFFEPSNIKDSKSFEECIAIADVFKFANDRIQNYDEITTRGRANLEIQTLGAKGLLFRQKGNNDWNFIQGYKIDNVIDTAGAGDWCTSGIIANLFFERKGFENISSESIIYSLRYGQALSALNCTYEGARGLMYDLSSEKLKRQVLEILTNDSLKISITESKPIRHQPKLDIKISSLYAGTSKY